MERGEPGRKIGADIVIFEEDKKGDKICNRAIDEMVDVLGKGIANICYVVNPEVVVLGGGIMAQEAFLKDRLKKQWENTWCPAFGSIQVSHLPKTRTMPVC